jgi:D-glycero-beta-D-manno-heptose 1-phosphate adenylyltransferase
MICTLNEFKAIRQDLKSKSKKIVFTNGCFDIIHAGHIDYLIKAKELGDVLIIGLNTDASVRRNKGDKRPIINENERAFILSNIKPVDYVILFDEDTPSHLINEILPDILVKGGDWEIENIVGRETVENNGGKVESINFTNNQSTSKIIEAILSRFSV